MVTTLPPLPKRPAKRQPVPHSPAVPRGLPPRHGLKPPSLSPTDVDLTVETKSNAVVPPPLLALQTPPSEWTTATPRLTLPLLLLCVLAWVGFGVVGLLAAPLPNWSEGLLEAWQQMGNVTAPVYAHVWDAIWYRPQLPWAMACGAFLGPWAGMMVAALWLGLSLLGLPLMASGGGPGLIVSPVFGFALGLVGAAGVAGWLTNAPSLAHPVTSTRPSKRLTGEASSEETLTLLQRAQVPSLVALRRQKKLEEKRQQQANAPLMHPPKMSLRTMVHRVTTGLRLMGTLLSCLKQGVIVGLSTLRPSATPQKASTNAFAFPLGMVRLCLISLLVTATAHAIGWLALGTLSVQFLWPVGNPLGAVTAQGFLAHWGSQLSNLSWGYDALFGLCGLMVAQGLRRVLGIVLFD